MLTPATTLEGCAVKLSLSGAPGVTVVVPLPLMLGSVSSDTRMDWVPTVPRVMDTPEATPSVKVTVAGSSACASEALSTAVPV